MFLRHNYHAILWALFIIMICALPAENFPPEPVIKNFDKAVHFYLFAQFSYFLVVGFKKQYQFRVLRNLAIRNAFLVSVNYGIIIEILQKFYFTERNFDGYDILANFFGTIFGIMVFYIIYGKTNY